MKVLLLSADVWEMQDDRTGKTNSGVTVWFINEYREDTADSLGSKPTKVSASLSLFQALKTQPLPCLAEVDITTKPGKDGKPALTVLGIKPIKEVKVFN